jgi:hypothetical protein
MSVGQCEVAFHNFDHSPNIQSTHLGISQLDMLAVICCYTSVFFTGSSIPLFLCRHLATRTLAPLFYREMQLSLAGGPTPVAELLESLIRPPGVNGALQNGTNCPGSTRPRAHRGIELNHSSILHVDNCSCLGLVNAMLNDLRVWYEHHGLMEYSKTELIFWVVPGEEHTAAWN